MSYKLTYFNITGLGEPIRFLLSYGGLEFEDKRIAFEEWPELKEKTPFGQVPMLEIDGKVFNQSSSLCRYLAKKVDLNGKNDLENLEIDAIVDTVQDVRVFLAMYFLEKNEEAKARAKEDYVRGKAPYVLERLDRVAAENDGHLALGRLTWADLFFGGIYDTLDFLAGEDVLSKYKNLVAVRDNVYNLPQIKAWLEKGPKTER